MNNDAIQKNKKLLLLGAAAVLVLLIAVFGGFMDNSDSRAGKIPVEVLLLPSDATATAGDTELRNGTVYLAPDTYSVTVSRDGFQTVTQDLKVDANQNYIQVGLTGVSEEAKQWERENAKLIYDFERKVGKTSQVSGEAFFNTYPIARLLPEINLIYKIGYTSTTTDAFVLTIHAVTADQRKAALQQIRDWGYDPTDYKIKFTQFINPLE